MKISLRRISQIPQRGKQMSKTSIFGSKLWKIIYFKIEQFRITLIINMQPLYIVYTENQNQKKHLEGEFLQKSGHFAVPLSQASTLKELIQKTCYEFYDKDVSIFIEKLKNLIVNLIEFNFSFPLWRDILSTLKRKDLMAERYRKYVIEFDKLFVGDDTAVTQMETSQGKSPDLVDEEFQKALNSYKTLEVTDIEDIFTMGSTGFGNFIQKPSIHQSQKTNDQSVGKSAKKPLEITFGRQEEERVRSFGQITPIKNMLRCFQQQLTKDSKNAKNNISNNYGSSNQFENFINSSFKKQKTSPIAQMIINDQSLRNIARKQKKMQKDRTKLQDELYQKTKTIKSKEYNKNIKTILMNHKIRDRRKAGFEGQKSTISGVVGAYELRRVSSSEVFHFEDEDNLKLFRSAGKPYMK